MKEMERNTPLDGDGEEQRDSIHFGGRALIPLRWIAIELLRRQARGFKIGGQMPRQINTLCFLL